MRFLWILLTLFIVAMGIAFTALNSSAIQINYLIGSKMVPLALLLLIALVIGALFSMLIMGLSILQLRAKNVLLEKKLKRSQEVLAKMSLHKG